MKKISNNVLLSLLPTVTVNIKIMKSCRDQGLCKTVIATKPVLDERIPASCNAISNSSLDFSLGEKLQSVYPILDLVFTYLNYKDLLSASLVCKTWRETALEQLKARQRIAWFSSSGQKGIYDLKRSCSLLRNNPYFSIILVHSKLRSLKTQICVKYSTFHGSTKGK